MIWFLLIVSAILGVYYFLIKPQLHWYFKNVNQGFPIPIFGDNFLNILQLRSAVDVQRNLYKQFPNQRYRGFYQATTPTLMILDAELLKKIGVRDFDHFVDHGNITAPKVDPIWGKNLLSLKSEEWRNMRSIVSPAFTSSKMKAMFSLMNERGVEHVKYCLDQDEPLLEMEMKDYFSRFAIDLVASCAFGIENDSLKEKDNEFFKIAMIAASLTSFKRIFLRFLLFLSPKLLEIFNLRMFSPVVSRFVQDIVDQSIEYREKHPTVRPDMIHVLMEARKGRLKYEEDAAQSKSTGYATVEESYVGTIDNPKMKELTNFDIAAQLMIFFLAGFDTLSTSMSFTALELAQNPDIQEKLRKEIDQHYLENEGKLSYDMLPKMKYLDMVISESLRKYPAFIGSDRICTKPYTIDPVLPNEKSLHINVGDVLLIPIIGIHYNPNYYPEPDRFDPERFSDENKANIKPYSYVPFGLGPRNCIGSRFALMEMKTLLFHLLSKFEIVVTRKTLVPIKLSKKSFNPYVDGGFWVGLKKRTDIVNY